MKFINNMTEKEKHINESFKNHKINIYVEEKEIEYYTYNNDQLGSFHLKTNNFYMCYWFYKNLKKHFKNTYEMIEFVKPVLRKIIHKEINVIY